MDRIILHSKMCYFHSLSSMLRVLTEFWQCKKGKNIAEKEGERLYTQRGFSAFAIAQNVDF